MLRIHLPVRQLIGAILATLSFATAALAADVNQATQAELEAVKGIGPGLSAKILKAREQGKFKDWADFQDRVSGIGTANSAKFSQAGLTVAGAGFEGGAVKPPAKAAGAQKAAKPAAQ